MAIFIVTVDVKYALNFDKFNGSFRMYLLIEIATHGTFKVQRSIVNLFYRMYRCKTINELHLPKMSFVTAGHRRNQTYKLVTSYSISSSVWFLSIVASTAYSVFIRPTKHHVCLHCVSAPLCCVGTHTNW